MPARPTQRAPRRVSAPGSSQLAARRAFRTSRVVDRDRAPKMRLPVRLAARLAHSAASISAGEMTSRTARSTRLRMSRARQIRLEGLDKTVGLQEHGRHGQRALEVPVRRSYGGPRAGHRTLRIVGKGNAVSRWCPGRPGPSTAIGERTSGPIQLRTTAADSTATAHPGCDPSPSGPASARSTRTCCGRVQDRRRLASGLLRQGRAPRIPQGHAPPLGVTWRVFRTDSSEPDLDALTPADRTTITDELFAWVSGGPPRTRGQIVAASSCSRISCHREC